MKRLAPLALIAALALTGCAPIEFEQANETAPAVHPSQMAELSAKRALSIEGQEWADALMSPYLEDHQDFSQDSMPGAPVRRIMNWGASSPGELEISVSGQDWASGEDLDFFASKMLEDLNDDSIESIAVATLNGELSSVATAKTLLG